MMGLADSVARFFKNSPKRQVALEMVINDESDSNYPKRTKLKEMCRTRWVERQDAFEIFVQLYHFVVKCLEDISGENSASWNRDTVADARSLYLGITDFEFVITLVSTKNVMAYSKTLTVGLQGRGIDIVRAYEVNVVTECLQDVRTNVDHFCDECFKQASKLAEEVNVEPTFPRTVGRMRHRANCPAGTPEEYYKRNLVIPLLDHFLSEFQERFTDNSKRATQILHLIPSVICSKGDIDMQQLDQVVEFYHDDLRLQLVSVQKFTYGR